MDKFDAMDNWIANVQFGHSKSVRTEENYRSTMKRFCEFIEKTPEQILEDLEDSSDREFRRKYARYLRAFITHLSKQEAYALGTISTFVGRLRSFFKYHSLPLDYVPTGRSVVTYHNRDITREEIAQIFAHANLRDRAYFCMMAQSGLRPTTLNNLRFENIQQDFKAGTIPMRIDVPQEIAKGNYRSYFTFVGPESVRFLRLYLNTRPHIQPDDLLFATLQAGKERQINPKSTSKTFHQIVRQLEKRGVMTIKKRIKGKPAEVRLYNLRKFFRKYATPAGFEYVQYWMGHVVKAGVDEHYRPKDPEFHRKLYAEKAMPYLRIETATPNETEQIIQKQAEDMERLKDSIHKLEQKNSELKQKLNGFTLSSGQVSELLKRIEKLEKLAQKQ